MYLMNRNELYSILGVYQPESSIVARLSLEDVEGGAGLFAAALGLPDGLRALGRSGGLDALACAERGPADESR